jgi:methylmalonyl-CoA mutase
MMTADQELTFASAFAHAGGHAWKRLVDTVLKGRSFETLFYETYDGLRIAPLHSRTTGARTLAARPAPGTWEITQRIEHPDPAAANAQALDDLENGAAGLSLEFAGGPGARGFGIAGEKVLATVLDGVVLEAGVRIHLQPVLGSRNIGEEFANLVADRGIAPEAVNVAFNYQPLSTMAVRGARPGPWPEMAPAFAKIVRDLQSRGFRGPFALADGRPVHDAGGSEAQELAFALAVAVAYLRALEAGGMALPAARTALCFRLVADADQFLTIAKFRALRKLWARVEDACGLAPEPAFVAAETAWRMMTTRDPHVNTLRTTVAAFSAAVGGANAITVLPFTAAIGLPDAFARRLARNMQLLLAEEAHLAKVSDPGAGSGAVEDLTTQLCTSAWSLFQEIERAGGVAAALTSGMLQEKVAVVRAAREGAVADGKEPLIGTTVFPNADDMPVAVLDTARAASPSPPPGAITFPALAPIRLGEPFEGAASR